MTSSRQQPSEPPSDAGHHASSWEKRYASVEQLWSGRPNNWLPELAVDWEPGAALEIGCGEGADVLWLAEHGWRVTGLDLSATAVARLSREAERRGVASRVTGRVHDVGAGLPEGPFDPPWHRHHARTYTAGELVTGLAEATAGWEVVVAEERQRRVTGPDGQEDSRADAVVCLRRPPASV